MKLYHVTMMDRVEGINANGVDPKFAQGKTGASWWVEADWLLWAIVHISARHHVPTDALAIYQYEFPGTRADLPLGGFRRWRTGRWMCFKTISQLTAQSVDQYMVTHEQKQ